LRGITVSLDNSDLQGYQVPTYLVPVPPFFSLLLLFPLLLLLLPPLLLPSLLLLFLFAQTLGCSDLGELLWAPLAYIND
jgi:hypothetical protein